MPISTFMLSRVPVERASFDVKFRETEKGQESARSRDREHFAPCTNPPTAWLSRDRMRPARPSTPEIPSSMTTRQPLPVLFATLFVAMTGFGIIIPTLPFLATSYHLDAQGLGFLLASYSAMNVIFAPIWGRVSDRIGRRSVMGIGACGLGLSFAGYALSSESWMLFASRILGGILGAALLPTAKAYAIDISDDHTRSRHLGVLGAGLGLGMVVGPALGGLASRWNATAPFWLAAAMSGLTALLVLLILPETQVKALERMTGPGIFRKAGYQLASLATLSFTQMLAFTAMEATFVLYGHDHFGLDAMNVGLLFLGMGLVSAGFQGRGVARLIDRLGEMGAARLGCMALGVGFIGIPLAPHVLALFLAFCMFGIGAALLRTSIASQAARRATAGNGLAMGIIDASDSLARALGPVMGGVLYTVHAKLPYHAGSAIVAIALVLTWLVDSSPAPQSTAKQPSN